MTHLLIRLTHSMGLYSGAWKGGKPRCVTVTINLSAGNSDGYHLPAGVIHLPGNNLLLIWKGEHNENGNHGNETKTEHNGLSSVLQILPQVVLFQQILQWEDSCMPALRG